MRRDRRAQRKLAGGMDRPATSQTADFEQPSAVACPDDGDQECGGDDVAEAEQAIGPDDAPDSRRLRQRRLAARLANEQRPLADKRHDAQESDGRDAAGPEPAGLPWLVGKHQRAGHQRRCRDADANAAEMQCLQIAAAGGGEMAEDNGGEENQHEGAGETGDEADEQEGDEIVGEAHQHTKNGRSGDRRQHDQALAPVRPTARAEDGADEIAEIIGRRDQPGVAGGQAEFIHHARQDGRVDETADAHGGSHAEKTADGITEG